MKCIDLGAHIVSTYFTLEKRNWKRKNSEVNIEDIDTEHEKSAIMDYILCAKSAFTLHHYIRQKNGKNKIDLNTRKILNLVLNSKTMLILTIKKTDILSKIDTVEPRSIVPVSIVFPHLPFAIFGPE